MESQHSATVVFFSNKNIKEQKETIATVEGKHVKTIKCSSMLLQCGRSLILQGGTLTPGSVVVHLGSDKAHVQSDKPHFATTFDLLDYLLLQVDCPWAREKPKAWRRNGTCSPHTHSLSRKGQGY